MFKASPINSRAAVTLDCCANANDAGQVSATSGVPRGPIRTNRSTSTDVRRSACSGSVVSPWQSAHAAASSSLRHPAHRSVARLSAARLSSAPGSPSDSSNH